MKICIFILISTNIGAIYNNHEVPGNQPRMFYDGTGWKEWKSEKPERDTTSSTNERRHTLSELMDMLMFSTTQATSPTSDNMTTTTQAPTTPTEIVFDNIFGEENDKTEVKTTTETNDVTNLSKIIVDLRQCNIALIKLMNSSKPHKNQTSSTLIPNNEEWLTVVADLSKTLRELIEVHILQNNVSNHTQMVETSTTVAENHHKNVSNHPRRTMNGIDDLLALLSDGIEIDNESDSSDDLNKSNRKFIKSIVAPKSARRDDLEDHIDSGVELLRDTDSAEFISDGEEEPRRVLVKDKSNDDTPDERHERGVKIDNV